MAARDPKVDAYVAKLTRWREETEELRALLLGCELEEAFKWRQPCYAFEGKNLFIIGGFEAYCALAFFNGALLRDDAGLLVKPGPNTQAGRQMRFTSADQVRERASLVRAYVLEAIEAQRAGLKLGASEAATPEVPEELSVKLTDTPGLREGWEELTPGKRRGYLIHFTGARKPAARTTRIDKCIPKILAGKGFHDCVCGLSRRLPRCDGSHRQLNANPEVGR